MQKNLTEGSPMKLLLGFTIPTLFGMLFQQFYNLVDTMIVGKLLGAKALAAVGATGSVNFLILGFCIGLCSGFALPVAREIGAGKDSRMRRCCANAAYLSAVFALVLTVATCVLCGRILVWMDTPADIFVDSYRYIFIIFLGIPACFLYNLLAGIIRSLGDSRTPVYFLALSSVLNIGLDIAFILWTDMGVAGAALATVISQLVSGVICLLYVRRRFPILRFAKVELQPDHEICVDLCCNGIPMGLQYSVTAIGSILLQTAVNGLGSLYVAAMAAGSKVQQLLACPFDAMGAAMAAYCGQNTGARKPERLGVGIRDCAFLGLGYSLIAYGAMFLWAPQAAMLFLDPAEPELELLVTLTSALVRSLTAFFFPLALVNIVRFSIQGMGFSPLAIVSGAMEMGARAVFGRVFVPALGFSAAIYASPVAWLCADLFLLPACAICIRRVSARCKSGGLQPPRHIVPRMRTRAHG